MGGGSGKESRRREKEETGSHARPGQSRKPIVPAQLFVSLLPLPRLAPHLPGSVIPPLVTNTRPPHFISLQALQRRGGRGETGTKGSGLRLHFPPFLSPVSTPPPPARQAMEDTKPSWPSGPLSSLPVGKTTRELSRPTQKPRPRSAAKTRLLRPAPAHAPLPAISRVSVSGWGWGGKLPSRPT